MALRSPRFVSSERLRRAAENNPPLASGESGQPVRILQQALIDLGFDLPLSTRKYGSPDGLFGNETASKVRDFQKKYGLSVDGVVGRETMTKLDGLLPSAGNDLPPLPRSGFTHKVRLHLRSIAMPQVSEMTQLKIMGEIYAQYAIKIELASGESVGFDTQGQPITLTVVDGDCKWDQLSDEQRFLQNLGDKLDTHPNDITVYYAPTLRELNGGTLQGCAGSLPERPAVMIAADAVDKTTMAHEVGHLLLGSGFVPVHDNDSDNLMCAAAICTGKPAYLNDKQLKAIRGSRFLNKLAF
ncbi:MAG TPA: peptidoglycan-binding domain-containing protein [Candidatus Sulfotelmatobacter sp.]|nr:peptidoglycan-binding domain-containing protein [Candidatus Sulfotelmatobacter sp.]